MNSQSRIKKGHLIDLDGNTLFFIDYLISPVNHKLEFLTSQGWMTEMQIKSWTLYC
jgi:hypothetical protein